MSMWETIVRILLELAVLGVIIWEVFQLKKHNRELLEHSRKLDKTMPLYTNVFTEAADLQRLAVSMIDEAERFCAVGILDVLARTEYSPPAGRVREAAPATPFDKDYVSTTSDFIDQGKPYSRIANLSVANKSDDEIWTVWANIRYFKRFLEEAGARHICLKLYHQPSIQSGRNEFHFRVTDKKVVIRIGSPNESSSSAGISMTDTRVIARFEEYSNSLIEDPKCIMLDLPMLSRLDRCLSTSNIADYEGALIETHGNA